MGETHPDWEMTTEPGESVMEAYAKWNLEVLIAIIILAFAFGMINFIVDPLWCFSHSNRFNKNQNPFNERQQKTNILTFQKPGYDSLLLGSSRATYIDQNDFTGLRVFNYSANGMKSAELNGYIEYAKRVKGGPLKCIILALDFDDNARYVVEDWPSHYIDRANSFLYRFRTLLSVDTFIHSLQNLRWKSSGYNRDNVKVMFPVTARQRQKEAELQLRLLSGVREDANIKELLRELKHRNPETRFIIFTTPVSKPLFDLFIKTNGIDAYEKWLRDCVEVFGEIYNFMYPNSVTTNPENYKDAHHFHPRIGTLIAHKLLALDDPNIPADFGILVTKDNIDEHLRKIRKQVLGISQTGHGRAD